jgi:hypothetical protein
MGTLSVFVDVRSFAYNKNPGNNNSHTGQAVGRTHIDVQDRMHREVEHEAHTNQHHHEEPHLQRGSGGDGSGGQGVVRRYQGCDQGGCRKESRAHTILVHSAKRGTPSERSLLVYVVIFI